jgi:NAD(P)-dependent dehydrogenase (short-subunit alcohol dehydrogenase family)
MDNRLAGKVAIVTGAAQGLGEASARRFAQAGAKVALVDVKREQGEAVTAAIGAAGGVARFFHCDLTKPAAVRDCIASIEAAFDHVDILYNNAGVSIAGTVETLPEEHWDLMFDINVKAKYIVSRHVVPLMRRGGGGSIINQSSESGITGSPYHPGYCASMGAVVNLTRAMALSHAPDRIRVNAICPGTIPTQVLQKFLDTVDDGEAVLAELKRDHPLGLGETIDIANAALFLASDEAKYVTGAILAVDGGYSAR